MAKIGAVVVCRSYSDFYVFSSQNKYQFDYMVCVSDPRDLATKAISNFYGIHHVETEVFYKDGAKFNKGAAINEGIKVLLDKGMEWIAHMDADIIVSPRFKEISSKLMDEGHLDPTCIYGMDRVMVNSFDEWMAFLNHPEQQHAPDIFVLPTPFRQNVRIAKFESPSNGYIPIGYFQMWNHKGCGLFDGGNPVYPDFHSDAGRSDMLFALQWPRLKRQLLPEMYCYHLATVGDGSMGQNWNGRTTPFFGPSTGVFAQKIVPIPKEVAQDITLQKQAALSSDNNTFAAYGD